jgi:RNA polymerase sigma-70 factor (ECF subfamily)
MTGDVAIPAAEFAERAEPYRRELLALCYRMLGSVDEAEDLVQETYLHAWRAYDGFEERASLRTWLYRIATRACLKALERGVRRPLPSGLRGPTEDPTAPLDPAMRETPWLQPFPDARYGADPAAAAVSREGMRLALVAAVQYLPPRQRAVLILRDVLAWRANEVAELVGVSTAAVNSALQRARDRLARVAPEADALTEPAEPERRALLDRYARAFEHADIPALMDVLTEDAVWEMPPIPNWFAGRAVVGRFLLGRGLAPGDLRLRPTAANGQPAFAVTSRDAGGVHRPHSIHVLSVGPAGISRVVDFHRPGLFGVFGF